MSNPKIPKNDRLENKHVPGRGSGSKAAIYDRNQFIRSYFRYKKVLSSIHFQQMMEKISFIPRNFLLKAKKFPH